MNKKKIIDHIYTLSSAVSREDKFKAISETYEPNLVIHKDADPEVLERMVQDTIRMLLDVLRESDRGEVPETDTKAIVVDANDNNVIEPAQGEGREIYPMVPPPPGAIDQNATGIPDNARKTRNC